MHRWKLFRLSRDRLLLRLLGTDVLYRDEDGTLEICVALLAAKEGSCQLVGGWRRDYLAVICLPYFHNIEEVRKFIDEAQTHQRLPQP